MGDIYLGPSYDLILSSVNKVLGRIEAPENAKQRIRELWIPPFQQGEARLLDYIKTALNGFEWRWPELYEWYALFEKEGYFPYMWLNGLDRLKDPTYDSPSLARALFEILSHTLSMTCYTDRDLAFSEGTQISRVKVYPIGEEGGSISYCIEKEGSYTLEEMEKERPPWFPGCRCNLDLVFDLGLD